MGLSGLDSKKCHTILQHKTQSSNNSCCQLIISGKTVNDNKKVDEHGEMAVKCLKAPRREFTLDEVDTMVAAYRSGEANANQLAKQFGCSKTTISKILKKQGVNVTKSKAQAKLDAKVVIAMYAEMHTTEEIAERFKVNPQTILRCLRNHGVKIRSRWDYATE